MRTIATNADMTAALAALPDTAVGRLLADRWHELADDWRPDLSQIARFVVVEPGDGLPLVEVALGFSPMRNLVDGAAYGEPEFTPSFEWVLDHGGLFEAPFVLSDDGFGFVMLVLDQPGVDAMLLRLLREHAQPAR